MPSNVIQINGSGQWEWYVGDSKIEKLISWLYANGEKPTTCDILHEVDVGSDVCNKCNETLQAGSPCCRGSKIENDIIVAVK